MLNICFIVDKDKLVTTISLCLKADRSFDKTFQYNVKFFMQNVDICGRETGVWFEYKKSAYRFSILEQGIVNNQDVIEWDVIEWDVREWDVREL